MPISRQLLSEGGYCPLIKSCKTAKLQNFFLVTDSRKTFGNK